MVTLSIKDYSGKEIIKFNNVKQGKKKLDLLPALNNFLEFVPARTH